MIDIKIVEQLIKDQFPQWQEEILKPVENQGHDNTTYYLGADKLVRLPNGKEYEAQVLKENKWLPIIKEHVSVDVTAPLAIGEPSSIFPRAFSINQFIPGEDLSREEVDGKQLAVDLAVFLKELQMIESADDIMAGQHNFFRGGDIAVYSDAFYAAVEQHKNVVATDACLNIWEAALKHKWTNAPVLVHGDVAVGNLLAKDGKLSAVIDFGVLGAGDPACDLVMAWTYFNQVERQIFMEQFDYTSDVLDRAKGWALWKALITLEQPLSQKVVEAMNVKL